MVKYVIFAVIAIAIIFGGVWYNNKQDEKAKEDAVVAEQQAAAAQQKIMDQLKIEDVVVGTGAEAKNGDMVSVNYTGTLTDGTKFDSNTDPKFNHVQPFQFTIGAGQVIRGWDLGVAGMKVGGKRKLTIPPELAYGSEARGPIPANAILNFTVELLDVTSTPQ